MPFDVLSDAGGVTVLTGGVPSNVDAVRLLTHNAALHPGTLLTAQMPSSNNPNPSSALPGTQGLHLFSSPREQAWRSRNYFQINSSTTKGIEFAPNTQAKIKIGGTTYTASTGNERYNDPLLLAGVLKAAIDTAIVATGKTVTLVFDDERRTPTNPTYKWTLTISSGTCQLIITAEANTWWPMLGFGTSDTGTTASHTGAVACHSEEYFCLNLEPEWTMGGQTFGRYRWLVLVDPNFAMSSYDSAKGGRKCVVYTASTLAALDEQQDSTFTINSTMFRLGTNLGTYEWQDHLGRIARTTWGAGTPSYWLVDLGAWRTATAGAEPSHKFMRVKIVDPTNPAGHLRIGYFFVGPGFYTSKNVMHGIKRGIVEASEAQSLIGGGFASTFRPPRKKFLASWDKAYFSASDVLFLESMRAAMRASASGGSDVRSATWDLTAIAGAARNTLLLDPAFAPAAVAATSRKALGLIYGKMTLPEDAVEYTDAIWGAGEMTMLEEARHGRS